MYIFISSPIWLCSGAGGSICGRCGGKRSRKQPMQRQSRLRFLCQDLYHLSAIPSLLFACSQASPNTCDPGVDHQPI